LLRNDIIFYYEIFRDYSQGLCAFLLAFLPSAGNRRKNEKETLKRKKTIADAA